MNFSKEESYDLFCQALKRLEDSTIFTCDKGVTTLIKLFTQVDELKAFIKKCSKSYDIDNDLDKMICSRNMELPRYNRQIVAVVTYLFYSAYSKNINLFNVISTSFVQAPAVITKYSLFVETVLIPYKKAFKELFLEDDAVSEEQNHNVDEVETKNRNKYLLLEEIKKIKEEVKLILGETSLNNEQCEKVRFILDSIYEAIYVDNMRMLKLAVIAVNSYMSQFKRLRTYEQVIQDVLSKYSII